MKREQITGEDAKQRIIRYVALQRHEYDVLWRRYREVVHECAMLHAENDRLRREART